MRFFFLGLFTALFLAGCGPAVQNIPVSSNPSGAAVYADGQEVCTAPCKVELTKDQDHILTFKLDGYKQADVQITRKYQTMQVLRDSAASGIRSASNVAGSPEAGAANALLNMGYEEQSGRAYVLTPTTVTVRLVRQGSAGASGPEASGEASEAQVSGTDSPQMGDDLKEKDAGQVGKEALEAGASAAAAACPDVTGKTGSESSHSSVTRNPDGSVTKKSSSTSTSVQVGVNPAEAAIGAAKLLEDATGDEKTDDEGENTDDE